MIDEIKKQIDSAQKKFIYKNKLDDTLVYEYMKCGGRCHFCKTYINAQECAEKYYSMNKKNIFVCDKCFCRINQLYNVLFNIKMDNNIISLTKKEEIKEFFNNNFINVAPLRDKVILKIFQNTTVAEYFEHNLFRIDTILNPSEVERFIKYNNRRLDKTISRDKGVFINYELSQVIAGILTPPNTEPKNI